MRGLLALVLLPPLVFLLPWSVALLRGHRGRAAALFVAWAAAWACALWLWFGVGLLLLTALGATAVLTTTIAPSS